MADCALRFEDSNGIVELTAADRERSIPSYAPAQASFRKGGLTGAFKLSLFEAHRFADEIESVHRELGGSATLSDQDGFDLTVTCSKTGQVKVAVSMACLPWLFDAVEGSIGFQIESDQTFLPGWAASARALFPPTHTAVAGRLGQ